MINPVKAFQLKGGQTILVAYNPAFDDDDRRNHKDDKPTTRPDREASPNVP